MIGQKKIKTIISIIRGIAFLVAISYKIYKHESDALNIIQTFILSYCLLFHFFEIIILSDPHFTTKYLKFLNVFNLICAFSVVTNSILDFFKK